MKIWQTISLIVVFIFALGVYTLTLKGVPGNIKGDQIRKNLDQTTKPFELSPERGRFLLTMSLGEDHSFALNQQLAEAAKPDVGYYKGKFYIYFAPGISLIALPFYLVGRMFNLSQVFSYFAISIFAAFNIIFLFLISRNVFKLPYWASLLVGFIFAFGSTSWSYAVTMYQHQVTTFFIISSFYAIWKFKKNTRFSWFGALWTWFCFAGALAIDYPNAFLMLPVMLYLAASAVNIEQLKEKVKISVRLSALLTSVVFFALMALHGYYNYIHFGDWKKVSGSLVSYQIIQEKSLLKTQTGEQKLKDLAEKKSIVAFFSEQHLPSSNSTLLFSIDRGLFFYMPIFILGILGIWKLRKKMNSETNTLVGLIAINIFLYSSWGDPWGGWAFGTRYLIPTMAYLSLFVGIWISKKYSLWKAIPAFILFSFSSAVSLLGVLTTNAIPPKVEADFLHTGYNFMQNLIFFKDGKSSSFIFNTYASHYVSLTQYYQIIYFTILIIVFFLLFILPWFNKDESKD